MKYLVLTVQNYKEHTCKKNIQRNEKRVGAHSHFLHCTGCGLQDLNGSPVYPGWQVQDGKWFTTWQPAFVPQVPGQGS
jgi:hypothetical protein